MAINLTEGAVALISEGAVKSAEDMKPIVHVAELRVVTSQNQQSATERFRLLLSDGSHRQQAMLATQNNALVHSGKLRKGSVIQLTNFICNHVQNRIIIIIVDLDVILENYDVVGEAELPNRTASPVPSTNQQGLVTSDPQPDGGSSLAGEQVTRPNSAEAGSQYQRMDQSPGPYSSNLNSGRYGTNPPPLYPAAEVAAMPRVPAQSSISYSEQNMGLQNPRTEGTRPPLNAYGRPPQSSYQQPPPLYVNRGPIAKNEAASRIVPIAALNPYQGRWTIKARVTVKSDLRHYNNPRGDGKVFSFDLLDGDGGEIRVTCFNSVADQFYNQIEAGKVYMISRGSLKPAQKNFNHLRNEYEIFLEGTSTIQPCLDDDSIIPQQQFHFCPISEVEGMDSNSVVDLIGVVSVISPSVSIMRKNGTETLKRTLHLKDMSGRSVELTLWGNFCNAEGQALQCMCDSGRFPILAVKAGRVNDFNGKTVGTISTSQLFVEPDFPEACRLREWFEKEGKSIPSVSISREASSMGKTDVRKTISQIKDERLGTSEKPDWITASATISFIKSESFCYTACPIKIGDRQCSKKVTNNGDGKWLCDRCDQSVDECDYRYILQFQIQDHTGMTWVTAFQECGEEIMGISAKDLYFLKYEEQEDEKFAEVVRNVLFTKYIFKLKVKEETFSDEQRVKSTVVKAERLNFSSESKYLLGLVDKLKADDSGSTPVKPEILIHNAGAGNVGSRQLPQTASGYIGNSENTGRDFGMVANQNQAAVYGNQYNGLRSQPPDTSGPYIHCNSCGGTGHSSTNCPSIMSDSGSSMGGGYGGRGVSSGGTSSDCYKCNQPGHWARDCPQTSNVPPGGGGGYTSGGSSGECYKCNQPGHWARDCPQTNNIPPAYVRSGLPPGRYGGASNQRVGGF